MINRFTPPRPLNGLLSAAVALLIVAAAPPAVASEPPGLAFRVMKIVALDDSDTVINNAVLLVKNGRIEALGPTDKIDVPADYRIFNFDHHWLVPGIVEAHNHSTAGGWSDLNDMVYQTNPGLDTRCVPQPDADWVKYARRGGVTSAMLIPGSGTNLAGLGTVVSLGGDNPDEITMRSPGSLKIAQAGNPEWYFGGNGRMFMYWNLRQTMDKAREYHTLYNTEYASQKNTAAHTPPFDPFWDGIRPVFDHEMPITMHTQGYQLMMSTLDMFVGRFNAWVVLDHCTFNGWKLGPLVKNAPNTWTINGPRQYEFDRTARRFIGNASGWWKNGVRRLGINTDAPVVPQEELTYQAAMACWYGWLPYPALKGVTAVNAKSIGIYDRVGSLEPGKQADLTIWTGDPLDPRSACLLTIVKGEIIYDGTDGLRRF